jgi:hypothetical protein
VSIKKFKACGSRRHFILCLSIFPLSLAEAAGCRRRACLPGGGHDHGAGHVCRHSESEVRQRRACTGGGVSEPWHGGVMLVPTTARARHSGDDLSEARHGGARRRRLKRRAARQSAARRRRARIGSGVTGHPDPSVLEHLPRLLTSHASSPRLRTAGRAAGSRSRRCGAQGRPHGMSTTASSLDDGGHLPRQ